MVRRHQDKPASKSHEQPHSNKSQQPETMHDCGRLQGSGISTPQVILQGKDSKIRLSTSCRQIAAPRTEENVGIQYRTGYGFLQQNHTSMMSSIAASGTVDAGKHAGVLHTEAADVKHEFR